MSRMISPHFSEWEWTVSATAAQHGIANRFTPTTRANAVRVSEDILEPLRYVLGAPVVISSGLRVKKVNRLVKGVDTSEHVFGMAADIGTSVLTDTELFDLIRLFDWPFGQLIEEYAAWVHVSRTPHRRRHEAFYYRQRPGSDRVEPPAPKMTSTMTALVKRFQERAGFTGGDVDGKIGPMTRAAALRWREAIPYPMNG